MAMRNRMLSLASEVQKNLAAEFEYLAEVRPYEAESALGYYRTGFQRPPATLGESREVLRVP